MKSIVLFTRYYPYSYNSEDFISAELYHVANNYSITLVPFGQVPNQRRSIPDNVSINNSCCNIPLFRKIYIVCTLLLSSFFWKSIFAKDFWSTCKKISDKIYYCKILYGASVVKWAVGTKRIPSDSNTVFYSYWLTFAPLGLALLKSHGQISNTIIARTHGYEIYEKGDYIPESYPHFPLRDFTYKWIDRVYSISEKGKTILTDNYPDYKDKFAISHLGVNRIGVNNLQTTSEYSILSCSYLYELKRVPLIFTSINNFCKENPSITIKWVHIGSSRDDDGKGFKDLQLLVKDAVPNLNVQLMGHMPNDKVIDFYKNYHFNTFINLSTTEGVPVAIMEAESAGLSILATNVGSNSEIVKPSLGCLLDVNFTQDEFNNALLMMIKNYPSMSKASIDNYQADWSAKDNYNNFYKEITSVKS